MSSKRRSAKALSSSGQRLDHLADDPAVDRQLGRGRGDAVPTRRCRCAWQEARGVPQLGREVAIALDALLIELDVAALAFHRRQGEAQRVGAILVDQAERIDRIALRLGHLLALRVADQAVEVERLPRHLVHELHALHRHARIPEEQDVEAGDEHVVGVVALAGPRSARASRASRTARARRRTRCRARRRRGASDSLAGLRPALPPRSRRRRHCRRRRTRPGSGGPTRAGARRTRAGYSRAS